jgi:4-hydroxy-tetrahydrodipicolinate reductase
MKIALIGYGKMGRAIESVALSKGHSIVHKITADNLQDLTIQNLQQADVAIEFSQPDAAYGNVMKCFGADIPVVCGTTGWNKQAEEAKKICREKNQAFFLAPNFSIGVNIFFALSEQMARMTSKFPQYDHISINEIHHTQKKDAPSGTAVSLANDMIKNIRRFKSWKGYEGNHTHDDPSSLPVYSFRTGDVPGTHEIFYGSEDDIITLKHEAKGRSGFAKGAVAAAEWIQGKKGVFDMKDLLEL